MRAFLLIFKYQVEIKKIAFGWFRPSLDTGQVRAEIDVERLNFKGFIILFVFLILLR